MIDASFAKEQEYWNQGYQAILGIDEVGRGPWAGPVVACGVIFPKDCLLPFTVRDSKLLSAKARSELVDRIKNACIQYSIASIDVPVINEIGVGKAAQQAFDQVVKDMQSQHDFIFIDGFVVQTVPRAKQLAIIGGDKISASIAAASILAKVYRDDLMVQLHETYPQYGFDQHKGYGTALHQAMIKKHGLSPIHRTSFSLEKYL